MEPAGGIMCLDSLDPEDGQVEIAGTAASVGHRVAAEDSRPERETLRQVFLRASDALYRFILVRVRGDRTAAEDLLQQTCCEAARHLRPPVDHDECEAWLRGISRNLIRRHWRKSKREAGWVSVEDAALAGSLAYDMEAGPLPPEALIKEESVTQLMLAVTSLSAADQSLIFAYYFDGRPQATMARDWGVTEKSIESRLYRARSRLREALRNMERSGER
jgi:RNA polymerase sigma-70 factor (ECF subfamily)